MIDKSASIIDKQAVPHGIVAEEVAPLDLQILCDAWAAKDGPGMARRKEAPQLQVVGLVYPLVMTNIAIEAMAMDISGVFLLKMVI